MTPRRIVLSPWSGPALKNAASETAELASQKVLDKPDIFPVQEEECADRIKYRTKNVACTLR